ncbi:hypothetical protein [Shimia sp. MIT1388]|uniref:hypothetical protein n=1 Tax=Shimia sp. MIT1388 TaxID=3096992 RepID=UPI003999A249
MKSLLAQVNAMHRDWPHFQASLGIGPQSVIWFGNLKGLERQFHVSIEYGLPMKGRHDQHRLMPVVRVLRPSLIPNWDAEDESPLPHVYFERPDIRLSPLCLFDPKEDEWAPSMLISRTTVGWAIRWLAAYEFWEMTGRWIGGGRHDDERTDRGEDYAA